MADAIINPVEMSPVPTVLSTPPAASATPTQPGSATNEAPQEDAKAEAEKKREAIDQARAKAKAAHQAKVDAEREAKQKAKEEKQAKAALARETKPKDDRPKGNSAPELWRAAYQAQVGEARLVADPWVYEALALSERAYHGFERDLEEQPASQAKLSALTTARDNLRAVFEEDLGLLVLGLRSIRGGEAFVAASRDTNKVTMAKKLSGGMTPRHLGHNQPLLASMEKSLAEYEQAEEELAAVEEASAEAAVRIAEGKKLVQSAVATLKATVAAAKARQALLADLKAERRHPRIKAA